MARAPLALGLVVLIFMSTAAASPTNSFHAWMAGPSVQPQAIELAAPASSDTPYLAAAYLDLLGDINGDGKVDVLYTEERFDGEQSKSMMQALSGANLKNVLWTLNLGEDEFAWPAFDVDGDGIVDLLAGEFSGSIALRLLAPVPVPAVSAYEFDWTLTAPQTFYSGKSAQELGTFDESYLAKMRSIFGGAGGASVSVQTSDTENRWWTHYGGAGFLQTGSSRDAYTARAGMSPVRPSASFFDLDVDLRLTDVAGKVLAAKDIVGPTTFPEDAVAISRSTNTPLLVAAWRESVTQGVLAAASAHVSRLHLEAVSGTSPAWTIVSNPDLYLGTWMSPLPDLNGDGVAELQVFEFRFDPTASTDERVDSVVRNGATGAQMTRTSSPSVMKGYLPLGDLDADGKPELLWVEFDNLEFELLAFGAANADFKEIWRSTSNLEAYPINYPPYAGDFEIPGLLDLNGDGAPDVAMRSENALTVLDGKTGAQVWMRALAEEDQVFFVGEATGSGKGDFVIARVNGTVERDDGPDDGSNTAASIEYLAGETGKVIRTQVLRAPGVIPAGSAGASVHVTTVGDVDGDGRAEFAVAVVDHEVFEMTFDGEVEQGVRYQPTTYLFSLTKDKPLLTVGNRLPASGAGSGSLPGNLPAPEGGLDSTGGDGAKGAPVAPIGLLALGLGALVRMRRRTH